MILRFIFQPYPPNISAVAHSDRPYGRRAERNASETGGPRIHI